MERLGDIVGISDEGATKDITKGRRMVSWSKGVDKGATKGMTKGGREHC